MRFQALFLSIAVIFSISIADILSPEDAPQSPILAHPSPQLRLTTSLSILSTLINDLTETATSYKGSISQSLKLAEVVRGIKSALLVTIGDAEELPGLYEVEDEEGKVVVIEEMKELESRTKVALEALSSKAQIVADRNFTQTVRNWLETLRINTDLLFMTLIARSASEEEDKTVLEEMRGRVAAAFERATAVFAVERQRGEVKKRAEDYVSDFVGAGFRVGLG